MRMEQLKYIAEIAKTGTISGAAKNLYVSQQAVSSSMKQLEEELGVELLVRGASGVTFTTIGYEVTEFARQTMQQHDLLMNRIRYWQDNRDYEDLNINIASTSCVLNDVVPDVLSRLDYLNTKVTMQVALLNDSREVLEQVNAGKEGRRAVCYPGFENELRGATIAGEGVVTDGYVTTAKGMGVALAFSKELISLILGEDEAIRLGKAIMEE